MVRKKWSVREGYGAMCNICGRNCGKGGPLKKHIEGSHGITYDKYKKCFEPASNVRIMVDGWDDNIETSTGELVVTHVLVRRFIMSPGQKAPRRTLK